jgi:hypothetical protein
VQAGGSAALGRLALAARNGVSLSVTVDVGRDGKVCASDFVRDFDRTDFSSFFEAPPDDYTIVVKEYGDRCRPLDP